MKIHNFVSHVNIKISERKTPTCGVAGLGCLTYYAGVYDLLCYE